MIVDLVKMHNRLRRESASVELQQQALKGLLLSVDKVEKLARQLNSVRGQANKFVLIAKRQPHPARNPSGGLLVLKFTHDL